MKYTYILFSMVVGMGIYTAYGMENDKTEQSADIDLMMQLDHAPGQETDDNVVIYHASAQLTKQEDAHNLDLQKSRLSYWMAAIKLSNDQEDPDLEAISKSTSWQNIEAFLDKRLEEKTKEGRVNNTQRNLEKIYLENMGFWTPPATEVNKK